MGGLKRGTAMKWVGFVTAVWVQSISGNNYTFSNYSAALKTIMNLNQAKLNYLSVAKDLGKAFGLLAGFASDRIPPWLLLLIGSVEGFVGYGAQYLVVSQKIRPLPYGAMAIFMCMGGNSSTWMNTAILVTCLRNFRRNRGPASGILKGYVGLSTAIFTDLCNALFANRSTDFLLMLMFVPFAICLTAMVFLREVDADDQTNPNEDEAESTYFNMINAVATVAAFYLLAYDFIGSHSHAFNVSFSAVLFLLLASPLIIPAYVALKQRPRSTADVEQRQQTREEKEVTTAAVTPTSDSPVDTVVERAGKPSLGEDHTVIETLRSFDFWVLFVAFLLGVGPGMTVMNNMGQMGSALGYSDVSVFVSLLSIMGFFGRILSGTGSEYFIKNKGTPRPVFNGGSQVLMAVGFIVMAVGMPGSLYIGSCIIGFSYGVRLAVSVPVASELFGLKCFGLIYNILVLNLPIGSFLFSGLLAGNLYDKEATPTNNGGDFCNGPHCYRLSFFILAGTCLVGGVLDVWQSVKTKGLYMKIGASKREKSFCNGK
ncbi:hypothetical protein V2J09_000350 [Rumex salicifolius]